MKKKFLSAFLLLWYLNVPAQQTIWKQAGWECLISPQGYLEKIVFKHKQGNDTVPFFQGKKNAGPCFYADINGTEIRGRWIPDGYRSFRAVIGAVEGRLTYEEWKGNPALKVTIENKGYVPFQPVKAGLKLGIDTYMDRYPAWFGKYFPTLMRNEKTHFYGYLQTPSGRMLGIISPQPVASWSVDYNLGYQDPAPHWFMGHRIESLNLDLLNALPLPSHHPQDLWCLKQGESRSWIIAFVDLASPEKLETTVRELTQAPVIRLGQTTYVPGEKANFEVLSSSADIRVYDDQGHTVSTVVTRQTGNVAYAECILPAVGLYTIRATEGDKQAEGILSVRPSWQWTMEQARKGALKYRQKATSHIESWYGFHSAFLAARYFPDPVFDETLRKRFDYLFGLLHDMQKGAPRYYTFRIQNTSGTIGMLVDKYEAYGDPEDLRKASALADWLLSTWQREDGAYVNRHTVYTSVIYIAKSMLELALAERELAGREVFWAEAAERHYQSAKRAIDQLVAAQGNFETEGEMTFEDGMISCSALQIGMLGLMQQDEKARQHYTKALLELLESHDCLTQLRVPDARRRGGTMRYWEAQYDVQMLPNMFNSPHGWSGWRAYATYYAYLLTGEERWLSQTYNAIGAFAGLIDYRTGDLRWAFVVDPYLRVKQACSADTHVTADSLSFGNPHPELYDTREFVIGEQYVNMISDWQTVNTQDNDVHELFKCIGEVMLTNAFIVERPDGTLKSYNCRVIPKGNRWVVEPAEKQICNLHCNLKNARTICFKGENKKVDKNCFGWIFGKDIYK